MFFRKDNMKTIIFSTNMDIINEWKTRFNLENIAECHDLNSLHTLVKNLQEYIVIADFDTVDTEINKMISSNTLVSKIVVLEKIPEIVTGKMLINHGVKAYGNSRMLKLHYKQMIGAVQKNKIWTYPELTAALSKSVQVQILSQESKELVQKKLTPKEIEVLYSVLDGLCNDAIATKLSITTRTVKAHMSSIFTKLHINDRVALVLLLR